MVKKGYVPERGDFIWLEFYPQTGREQSGLHPALVLSPAGYNRRAQLAIVCPITSQIKGYPFEVVVSTAKISGVVLADQLRCLDWKVRNARFIARAQEDLLVQVLEKSMSLLIGE